MGCYNGTCNVSHLPIFHGEEIVVIPLLKTSRGGVYNTCNATDNFLPLGLPIFGKYNDYGGIEETHTDVMNEVMLLNREYFYETDEGLMLLDNEYDNFDDFVSEVICGNGIIYTKHANSFYHEDAFMEINYFMVHKELYEKMIAEIGNRIPYSKEDTYRNLLIHKFNERLNEEKEEIKNIDTLKTDIESVNNKIEFIKSMQKKESTIEISKNIFGFGNMVQNETWDYLSHCILMTEKSDELIELAVDMFLFKIALSFARTGYLCTSGRGSQSNETKMQCLIAEFILQHSKELAIKYYDIDETGEENDECEKEKIENLKNKGSISDTIFFF